MSATHDTSSCICMLCCTVSCSGKGVTPTVGSTDLETLAVNKVGVEEPKGFIGKWAMKAKDAALYGTSVDIHEVIEEDPFIAALHARAEKFDEHAEHAFGYLQVSSLFKRGGLSSTRHHNVLAPACLPLSCCAGLSARDNAMHGVPATKEQFVPFGVRQAPSNFPLVCQSSIPTGS